MCNSGNKNNHNYRERTRPIKPHSSLDTNPKPQSLVENRSNCKCRQKRFALKTNSTNVRTSKQASGGSPGQWLKYGRHASKSKWESSSRLLALCLLLLSSLSNTNTRIQPSRAKLKPSLLARCSALLCSGQTSVLVFSLKFVLSVDETLRRVENVAKRCKQRWEKTANGYSKINTDKIHKCREAVEGEEEVEVEVERQNVWLVSCVLCACVWVCVCFCCAVCCLERELYALCKYVRVRVRLTLCLLLFCSVGVVRVLLSLHTVLQYAKSVVKNMTNLHSYIEHFSVTPESNTHTRTAYATPKRCGCLYAALRAAAFVRDSKHAHVCVCLCVCKARDSAFCFASSWV